MSAPAHEVVLRKRCYNLFIVDAGDNLFTDSFSPIHPAFSNCTRNPMNNSAAKVHAEALVIDGHADTPQRFLDEGWNFTDPLNGGMLAYDAAMQGGLNAQFFAIWVDPEHHPAEHSARRTFELLDATLEQVRRAPHQLALCTTADEIVAAHRAGKFSVLLGIEGGHSIENSLGLLRCYYRLGVRYMTLTWANSNDWADSSGDLGNSAIRHHNGLTDFGRDVIREMNRLGMMVDVSHISDKTFWDVLETTSAPIIASHSSARSITPAMRNLTDDMMRAIAANNGIVMANFYPAFIDDQWRISWNALRHERLQEHEALKTEYRAKGVPVPFFASNRIDRKFAARIPRAPLRSLIDHFDHIIQVAGVDHVGIGSDFDGIAHTPEGIDSAADLPRITEELMTRGYSAEDMQKILGQNLLRVFRDVAAVGERPQITEP
jgi:membrane dipeptidase